MSDLFQELQRTSGSPASSSHFILAVAQILAQRIAVISMGSARRVSGRGEQYSTHPQEACMQRLLAAVPVPDPDEQRDRPTQA